MQSLADGLKLALKEEIIPALAGFGSAPRRTLAKADKFAANARAALDALAGFGSPPSTAQRFKAVALRAVADDLFQIAMGLMKARAESNLRT